MANALTALFGASVMIWYMWLINYKLNAMPLWICSIIGILLMLWGFWGDDWRPMFKRKAK